MTASVIGGFIVMIYNFLYGNGNVEIMIVLIGVTLLDWITGISAARIDHSYSSEYGKIGVARTVFMFLLPAVAHHIDNFLGSMNILFYMIACGLIYHTWMSMIANTVRSGWGRWVPVWLLNQISSELKAKIYRADERRKKFSEKEEEENKIIKTVYNRKQSSKKRRK